MRIRCKQRSHLPLIEIMRLAADAGTHDHLCRCAFCREQYRDAARLVPFLNDEVNPGGTAGRALADSKRGVASRGSLDEGTLARGGTLDEGTLLRE
ncbi:MAG: hypothetical protein RBU27_04155 [Bacteroidota bacterium]|jgi:hypothetical protein|nr:hypothetical protein [Bacteroidota bacterium]